MNTWGAGAAWRVRNAAAFWGRYLTCSVLSSIGAADARKPPMLYRGDSIPPRIYGLADEKHRGRTFADHFATNGLMAKFCEGGLLSWFQEPLPYLVAAHVGYAKESREDGISRHSPFLSFSTREQDAFRYMDRRERSDLEACSFADATYFVWRLESETVANEVQPGVYALTFLAGLNNVRSFVEESVAALKLNGSDDEFVFGSTIGQALVQSKIAADTTVHHAWLIDVASFLRANACFFRGRFADLGIRALANAQRDSEWLLYPRDEEPRLRGFSSRFQPSPLLHAHSWRRKHASTSRGGPRA